MPEFDEFNILPKRFIDLEKSVIDEEASDPENYEYVFKEKVYFDRSENKFPKGYLPKWARKTKHLQSAGLLIKRKRFGYEPVNVHRDKVLPEPFDKSNIDEEGNIVYVDGILCYVPYEVLAKKRYREVTKSDRDMRGVLSKYDDLLNETGANLDKKQREEMEKQLRETLGV